MKTIGTIFNFCSSKKFQIAFVVLQYFFAAMDSLTSQTIIPNGNFESWYDYDTLDLDNQLVTIHAPVDWCDFYCAIGYTNLASGLEEEMPGAAGTASALKITPGFDGIFGFQGWAYTLFPFSERPEKFTGYYQFSGVLPDTLLVFASFLKNDPMSDTLYVIGGAEIILTDAAEDFVKFESGVEWLSEEQPEFAQVDLLPWTSSEGQPDNFFVVDELAFESTVSGVGPDVAPAEAPFALFPVPAIDMLNLQPQSPADVQGAVLVQVYNQLGQAVLEVETAGLPEQLEIGHLNSGMYYLKISTDQQSWTKAWIKS